MSASNLKIEPASGRRQLREFIALPLRLYADDRNWVAPLRFEQSRRYSAKNPFFEHIRWQPWLLRRGGRTVGRISAQIDDLYEDPAGIRTGFFGAIEGEDDPAVFAALLGTAEAWLRENGVDRVRGPFNLSINEECGLLIEGYSTPPYLMMGHAHRYYAAHIESCGYRKAKDLYAYEVDPKFIAPTVMERVLDRARADIVVRKFRRNQRKQELAILRDLFNDSWSQNWGFTPITEPEIQDIGALLTLLIDDEFIQIAEINGRAVAMVVAIPDINQIIADLRGRLLPLGWLKLLWRLKFAAPDRARVMLMGVRKEYQLTRYGPMLSLLVIDSLRKALVRHGMKMAEMSWVLEDNAGMNALAEAFGGDLYKRYRLYEKSL